MTHYEHSLGDVIRQYRIERGFTQNELSEEISLSSRQIMSLEGDQCLPTFETLSKLVQVLNIPGDRIFYPDTDENSAALDSFIALYRRCPPEYQEVVLASANALVHHFINKSQKATKE